MVAITPPNPSRLRLASDADAPQTTPLPQGAALPRPAGAERPATDGVNLSPQARGLSEAMGKAPPVDRALVDRIGVAIAEGRYPVDPQRIAEAMFAQSFDLPH
jgi:negative regulator of flagellin synthesis FlgM